MADDLSIPRPASAEDRLVSLRARYKRSAALFERAQRVIPGGIHLSGRPLVDAETTPMYFARASGCRIWDVDGNQYIDYLMSFGAYLLGYARREVEAAAFAQAQSGRLVSLNHPQHIEFIEALLPRFPGAEMGVFFRTGSEATTAAVRIARRCTGRRKVARCGYHGWHDWCLPLQDAVPAGLDDQVPEFRASEPASLAACFEQNPGEIAAVILAPEMVLPHRPEIFTELARITRTHGAVFILDEVKTGLRIAPNSVAERVGVVPDLITVSKALGNGFAVAALLGRRDVMQHGAGLHYSATFHGDTAAMAAARKTLSIIDACAVQAHVHALGQRLIDGLNELVRAHGVPAEAYGEPLPPMPFFRFRHEDPEVNARLTRCFYTEVLARGVLLHPRHMWFISLAHTPGDIEHTLAVADEALQVARREL
ncbi:MAG: aminotransferase class III-fold pyridoxal phosphate-dependent enzyme [Polyangia bacterium]